MYIKIGGIAIENEDPTEAYRAAVRCLYTPGDGDVIIPPSLTDVTSWAYLEVARIEEEVRNKELLVNIAKTNQARRWSSDPDPTPEDYPVIYGEEAQEMDLTPAEMAEYLIDLEKDLLKANDRSAAALLKANKHISKAKDIEDVIDTLVKLAERLDL